MPGYDDEFEEERRPRRRRNRDYDRDDRDDRDFDDARDDRDSKMPHSGMGVASFVIALLAAAAMGFGLFFAVLINVNGQPHRDDDPEVIFVGLMILGACVLSLIGMALGFVGVFQTERRQVFTILGMVFNALLILGFCGIFGLGLAMKGG